MGNVLGRQPEILHIIPSKPNPWYGSIIEGERFTRQQLSAIDRAGYDPATVETITVTRNATLREHYWPSLQRAPVFQFECPVLSRRADTRVRVVSPSGDVKLVYADGWISAPPKRRRFFR